MEDRQTTRRRLGAVSSENTGPELALKELLVELGCGFRQQATELPGTPDFVSDEDGVAFFVHGCYWHRHEGCARAAEPKRNRDYWRRKFQRNVSRDKRNRTDLEAMGWTVVVVWECELMEDDDEVSNRIAEELGIH